MSRFAFSRLQPLWIAAALALPLRGEAAEPLARTQAWVMSIHYGAGNLSMDGDSLSRDFGIGQQFRLGHVVGPGLIAGLEVRSWTAQEPDTMRGTTQGVPQLSRGVRLFTMTMTKFPSASGLYARGGAGISTLRQEFLVHDPAGGASEEVTKQDVGFAVTAAGGWEYRFRSRISAELEAEYARFSAGGVKGNHFTYTAGLSLYW